MDFEILSPANTQELLNCLQNHQNESIKMGAGFTDLIIDIKKKKLTGLKVINLAKITDKEFTSIEITENKIRIGALVKVAHITNNKYLKENFPVIVEAALGLASQQIREVATIGGNICQASPSGDLSCAVTSLNAVCEILNDKGEIRNENLVDFFKGPGLSSLKKNEVLRSIVIPVNKGKKLLSGFIKIGKRKAMECSIVSLAYHIQMDEKNEIIDAGIATGAVAPTILFNKKAAEFLKGKTISSISAGKKEEFANIVQEMATPIDDVRSTAWYRKEVLYNSAVSVFE